MDFVPFIIIVVVVVGFDSLYF